VKKDYQILKETKLLHNKRKDLSRIQIIEFSILFIILNYLEIASKKIEDLSEIEFLAEKNESLKKEITTYLIEGNDKSAINEKISTSYNKIISEINENSNIQIIIKNKNDDEVANLLELQGVETFENSFENLLETLSAKGRTLTE